MFITIFGGLGSTRTQVLELGPRDWSLLWSVTHICHGLTDGVRGEKICHVEKSNFFHMWIDFTFHHMTDVEKSKIPPHGRFFLHGPGPWARDKYEVWADVLHVYSSSLLGIQWVKHNYWGDVPTKRFRFLCLWNCLTFVGLNVNTPEKFVSSCSKR